MAPGGLTKGRHRPHTRPKARGPASRHIITEQQSSMRHAWDVEADVVVVGFGAAGMAASVTAHDLGAKVVILEKAPEGQEGGNTRVAGQGYLNTSSVERRSPI